MARTPPLVAASRASRTTLMPGLESSPRQARGVPRRRRRATSGFVRRRGSRGVARTQRGRAPSVATSLALTLTASQPRRWAVKVMGSVFATRSLLPQSITAASSPRRGPRTTRDDFGMGHDASSDSSRRGGSLPTGSLAPWRMERGVYPRENLLARRRKAGATASIAPGLVVYLGCHG